ncbi:DUF1684 domain-containing protein [Halorussus marinus]|uniref:DUF1684 domain-containing protein n=1 Tax=Halorussus marinus TaxID=2505976 RepID=UPI00106EC614|nr:DUF1684 domain-containing protein [Halorussus marinus]
MSDAPNFDADQWREELESHRAEKDDFFGDHPQSPIPPEEREGFEGLEYFAPDPDYRVTAIVETHDEPDPVEMDVSAGAPQRYLRVATLRFELGGEDHELAAYTRDQQEGLFVPFRDKTTGQQTYQGGRYMEFETEGDLQDGSEITVDFNLAYSPFCAYSETFACPLAPEENWLETEVRAGERDD